MANFPKLTLVKCLVGCLFYKIVCVGLVGAKTPGCKPNFIHDCQDVRDFGFLNSGVYHVTPVGTYRGFDVYCDMDTNDGGWLVFHRREDGSENFYRGWEDYQFGFGSLTGEHWLGNYLLYIILRQGHYELRVDLEDWEGNKRFAKYSNFQIGRPEELYRLYVRGYSGNAGDSLWTSNNMFFSTKDRDYDTKLTYSCAVRFEGAWWYLDCLSACLNGRYHHGNLTAYAEGIIWTYFKGYNYSLKKAEMKIRRL